MRLKNLNQSPHDGFVFYYEGKGGGPVRVPVTGSAGSMRRLVLLASRALVNNGLDVPDNFRDVVEHQICLRQPDPDGACFSSGLGDDLHHKVMKPLFIGLSEAAAKVGLDSLAAGAKKVAGCSGCGGTRVYKQASNNLGRAGSVNNMAGFAGNADYKR